MNKGFVASYSGGKDSVLAIDRMIANGYELKALIIVYNNQLDRSWFHGIPRKVIQAVEKSLDVPIWIVETNGEDYHYNLEKQLSYAKTQGIELCVFGDIDITAHREWCESRCDNANIKAVFPLWQESRSDLVYEFVNKGYQAHITVIDQNKMSAEFLGKTLTIETLKQLANSKIDVCGENGEYHSFVSDGPIFKTPVKFKLGEKLEINNLAIMPVEY